MKKIIPSCSMCQNFDPLRYKCKISNEAVAANDTNKAELCNSEGNFIRDLNVFPDYFNLYPNVDQAPSGWEPELSKVAKDGEGRPLYITTNRGYERAIPAYEGCQVKIDDYLGKVVMWSTFQGQRKMVYELGYELAKRVIEEKGYELYTLPGEEEYQGFDKYKRHFSAQSKVKKAPSVLLADEPIEVWD